MVRDIDKKAGDNMRIKHFAGYGCVNAKKIALFKKDNKTTLIVSVSGDHEYGLKPFIIDDSIKWLAARFYKHILNIPTYKIYIDYDYILKPGVPDTIEYTFTIED